MDVEWGFVAFVSRKKTRTRWRRRSKEIELVNVHGPRQRTGWVQIRGEGSHLDRYTPHGMDYVDVIEGLRRRFWRRPEPATDTDIQWFRQ